MIRCRYALVLLAASLVGPVYAAGPRAVTVPFDLLRSGHMTVMVRVNGKGPYKLIFDTGAPITLLDNKVAREAGLLKNMVQPAFSVFGSMGEVRVRRLEVGGQQAENVTAVVMDHPTVEAISRVFGPIHGIVGFPFFARFKMTLDYQARTMTFVPNGFKPPDVMEALVQALLGDGDDAPRVLAPAAQWGMLAHKDRGDDEAGVTLTEVLPGSAAAQAGLKTGDRLLTLDGRWTDSVADLYSAAGYARPGVAVPVHIKRAGKELELQVKPVSGL
jgi:hypothetical protein